jgi:hypothetical protein
MSPPTIKDDENMSSGRSMDANSWTNSPLKLMSISQIYQGNMWKQQGGNR